MEMSINKRVRQIRKHFGLHQHEFAKKIAVSQGGVSWMEQEGNTVSEQAIKIICAEFNISESWLRTGEGDMFHMDEDTLMDRLCQKYAVSGGERKILEIYLSFDPERRRLVYSFIDDFFQKVIADKKYIQALDIEAKVEAYRQELLAKQKEFS